MAATFVAGIPTFTSATTTATSASFTPAAGETLFIHVDTDATNTIGYSSSVGGTWTIPNPPGQFTPGGGFDTQGVGVLLAASASAQTATISMTGATFLTGQGVRYSGVASVVGQASSNRGSPGTGVGAIIGVPAVVPAGSILLAVCIDHSASPSTITPAGGGTLILQGTTDVVPFCWAQWGGGATITPTFTGALGTSGYTVWQFVLAPSSAPVGVQPIGTLALVRRRTCNGGTNWGLNVLEWF